MADLNLKLNSLKSCDSQMAENCAEFELNTCSSKAQNHFEHGPEIRVDSHGFYYEQSVFYVIRDQLQVNFVTSFYVRFVTSI